MQQVLGKKFVNKSMQMLVKIIKCKSELRPCEIISRSQMQYKDLCNYFSNITGRSDQHEWNFKSEKAKDMILLIIIR